MNIKRGQKKCAECNTINGVRAFECKQCNTPFRMKKFKRGHRKTLIIDHTILRAGDSIRVVGGSGPYYEGTNGERIYLVDRGKYSVIKTDTNGIWAYGESGFEYLYMGITCKSDILDTIIRAPCKVLLVQKPSHVN